MLSNFFKEINLSLGLLLKIKVTNGFLKMIEKIVP